MATHNLRSVIGFNCGGQYAAIVQYFQIVDPIETNGFLLAKILRNSIESPSAGNSYLELLQDILSQDSFISSVRCQQLTPTTRNSAAKVYTPGDFAGNLGSDVESQQVAGCVIWLTGGDAGLTGRTFYPGVAEESLESGRFVTAYKTALGDIVDELVLGVQSATGDFHLVVKHESVAVYTLVTNAYLSLTPGTIRRRLSPV